MEGKTVSHYRILEKIGEGGMGQVYLAEDTSLERKVALKFLPEYLHSDPVAHKRFIREAKSAAALEHPYICNIKEVAQTDEGHDFIVMEYVEGQTLKECLSEGPLPLKQALQVGVEVAEALEVAHQRGIIHRDLKPANIVLTPQGHPKVMDFGLAKRLDTEEGQQEDLTSALTREGSTLGTPAYMSPEQIRAQAVDHRSDIFSFGIVLYEMLTGVHPFRRTTQGETTGAILHEEPASLASYLDEAPELLQQTIQRMLVKDPGRRCQTVHEARTNLEDVRETTVSLATVSAVLHRRIPLAVAGALFVVIASLVYWFGISTPQSRDLVSLQLSAAPNPLTYLPGIEKDPALSPDGDRVAFAWNGGGDGYFHIYVMPIGGGEPFQVTRAEADEVKPVWSSKDTRIAFIRRTKGRSEIWWVPFPTGKEDLVYTFHQIDDPVEPGLDWSPDGRYLALEDLLPGSERRAAIYLLDISSLEITQLTFPPPEALSGDSCPAFSPDGSQLAFFRGDRDGNIFRIHTQSVQDGKPIGDPQPVTPYIPMPNSLVYTPDGAELLYTKYKSMWRITIAGGEPREVVQAEMAHSLDVDRAGACLVYSAFREDWDIWRMPGPAGGQSMDAEPFIRSTRNEGQPRYSPDGSQIAFNSDRSGNWNIWLADEAGLNQIQLTHLDHAVMPQWSPQGDRMAFGSYLGSNASEIFVMGLNDTRPTPVTHEVANQGIPLWSPDGKWIYYNRRLHQADGAAAEWEIWRSRSTGGESQRISSSGLSPIRVDDGFVYFFRPRAGASGGLSADFRIWRVPTEGGEASQVLDDPVWVFAWAVWGQKLTYVDFLHAGGPALRSFDFATGQTMELGSLDAEAFPRPTGHISDFVWRGLTVSPDGKWILYGGPTTSNADLMVIEANR